MDNSVEVDDGLLMTQPVVSKGDHKMGNQEDVLAELCVYAPCQEVRDCLRLYEADKSTMQMRSSIKIWRSKRLNNLKLMVNNH